LALGSTDSIASIASAGQAFYDQRARELYAEQVRRVIRDVNEASVYNCTQLYTT
jgi:hypothetical protein